MIVGRKSLDSGSTRAVFVVLDERPRFPLIGYVLAKEIQELIDAKSIGKLEDGPTGGTPLYFGDDVVGRAIDAPLPESGGWNLARIADLSLGQTAYQIVVKGKLWLPGIEAANAKPIGICPVENIGEVGPYHMDINADTSDGMIRGPFSLVPIKPGAAPTYPVLWAHDAPRETTIVFEADKAGNVRKGHDPEEDQFVADKVAEVWASASHLHSNRDFQFNSQATAMQITPYPTIGGRAWTSIKLSSVEQERALALWANTSLGILLYWWHANKQQSGRGSIGKAALHTLPILDVTKLSHTQLAQSEKLFKAIAKKPMKPAHEMDVDRVRKELDEKFVRDVLQTTGYENALDLVRRKLALEPSILGTKTQISEGDEESEDEG